MAWHHPPSGNSQHSASDRVLVRVRLRSLCIEKNLHEFEDCGQKTSFERVASGFERCKPTQLAYGHARPGAAYGVYRKPNPNIIDDGVRREWDVISRRQSAE